MRFVPFSWKEKESVPAPKEIRKIKAPKSKIKGRPRNSDLSQVVIRDRGGNNLRITPVRVISTNERPKRGHVFILGPKRRV